MTTANTEPRVVALTHDEYHATPDLSCSMAKVFRQSRRQFQGEFVLGTREHKQPTRSMEVGTVGHAAILEPHVIEDMIVEIPADALTSNGQRRGKAWDSFVAEHPDKILFAAADIRRVRAMQAAAWAHPVLGRLLRAPGATEASLFWKCPRSGLDRKCRLDKTCDRWILDIKTTTEIAPRSFARVAADKDYDLQAAWYADGAEQVLGERRHFVFGVVSVIEPHPVRVYKLDGEAELTAWQSMDRTLEQIAECYASNDWAEPGENEIVELGMPRWKNSNQWELT